MKLTLIIFFASIAVALAKVHAQHISLNHHQIRLKTVLVDISKQSGYTFIYDENELHEANPVTIRVKNKSVEETLAILFRGQPLRYQIRGESIVIMRKELPEVSTISTSTLLQERTVTGTVTDAEGQPLGGVSVQLKNSERGAVTDSGGVYHLVVPTDNSVLIFSYVGFASQEVEVNDQTKISVSLVAQSSNLDEIVVVGYGVQKKVSMTGAVASLTVDKKMTNRAVTNVSSALSGLLPGLAVNQNSGMAGQNSGVMKIRGLGTVNNSNPLVVVDGMPDVDINRLNINDIESISVLKDATSAAVYGSRAANGVILITTKSGKGMDRTRIDFSSSYALDKPTNLTTFNNNYAEALTVHRRAAAQGGASQVFHEGTIDQWQAMSMIDPLHFPNTDWWDIIIRNGQIENYNLSVSGGNDRSNFYTSAGVMNQKGLQIGNDFKRYNARMNYEFKVRDNINGGVRFDGNWTDYNSAGAEGFTNQSVSSGGYDIYAAIAGITPYDPISGNYGGVMAYGESPQAYNPFARYENVINTTNRQNINSSVFLDWEPIDGLVARIDYAINYHNQFGKSYSMPTELFDFQLGQFNRVLIGDNAGISNNTNTGYKTQLNGRLNYTKSFGQHQLGVMGVYSEEYWYVRTQGGSRTDRLHPSLSEIDAASLENQSASGNSDREGLRSYIGRLNYSFDDRYLLEANFRYDASSKFAIGHQYGFFPSVAIGWNFFKEEFMQSLTHGLFASGKLRASYGSLGNNSGVGRYEQQETLSQAHYFLNNAIAKGLVNRKMINQALSWETTNVLNLGLDLGFLDNRFTAVLDYYDRLTTGMNQPSDLSLLLAGAYDAPRRNIGNLRNRGIEGQFTYADQVNEVNYSISVNASYNRNRLEKWREFLPKGATFLDMPYHFVYMYVDNGIAQSWQDIYEAPYQGQFAAPGDILREDLNGDGQITAEDRKALPNIQADLPTTNFGLNASASWKGIDVAVFLQGSAGRMGTWKTLYNTSAILVNRFASNDDHYHNTWSVDNRNAAFPRLYTGSGGGDQATSTFWMDDMSYLRVKNIQLGYQIPDQWIRRIGVDNVRVFASGENLFTITGYRGLDPERAGDTNGLYPLTKSFSFGINIGI